MPPVLEPDGTYNFELAKRIYWHRSSMRDGAICVFIPFCLLFTSSVFFLFS